MRACVNVSTGRGTITPTVDVLKISVAQGGDLQLSPPAQLIPESSSSRQLETQHHPERGPGLGAGRTVSEK